MVYMTRHNDRMTADEDLTAWLRAQLDEDERVAKAATSGPWFVHDTYLDRGGYTATVLSGEIGHGELRAWLPTMRGDVAWDNERNVWNDAAHIARHDPARVLREVQAKRERLRFIEQLIGEPPRAEHGEYKLIRDGVMMACAFRLMRIEAMPYADRPGYRDEWRP